MTTASGVLTYTTALTPAAAQVGGSLYPTSLGSRSKYISVENPYTGNKIEGWKWDERIWPDDNLENWSAYVPAIWDATTSGITTTYFQSGIGDGNDLALSEIQETTASGLSFSVVVSEAAAQKVWTPIVYHGYYYDYDEEDYLFSDDSEVVYPTYSGLISGISQNLNTVQLPSFPKIGAPIKATKYQWDSSISKYTENIDYRKRAYFTGLLDEDLARQETWDSDRNSILYHLIDSANPEFIVSYSGLTASGITPSVIFNGQCVDEIGTITISGIPDFTTLDILGYATGVANQQLRLTYVPIDKTSPLRIFSWLQSTSGGISEYKEWSPVQSGISITGDKAIVDYDLGIIEFGDSASLENVPTIGSTIGAYYYNTVRVEYEPEDTRDTVFAVEANINPVCRSSGRGFVYLTPRIEDPASITLASNLTEMSTDKYGPLYIGSTYAPIVATVTGNNGNLLEGVIVEFRITSDPAVGSFGNSETIIYATTNENGQATVYYTPPQQIADIGENIEADHVTIDGSPSVPGHPEITETTTLQTSALLIEASDPPDDVYVYGVYDDDPLVGVLYTGVASDAQSQINEYYRRYFDENQIYGPTGLTVSGVTSSAAIDWEDRHRILWDLARPSIYEQNSGMGTRKLIAEYSYDALNPHNPTVSGAWVPKQPFRIDTIGSSTYDVVFDTTSVSMPVPTGTLNSYLLIAPTVIYFQAFTYSDILNRDISSNEIQVKLDIPDYMNGTWLISGINNMNIGELSSLIVEAMEGKKLPLGFRLRSSTITLAAALDGVTYLDANANDDPFTTPSTWPPLRHKFNVSSIV